MPVLALKGLPSPVIAAHGPDNNRVRASSSRADSSGGMPFTAVLPLLQAATWEAWGDSLVVRSLNFGESHRPSGFLDRSYHRVGFAWLERVCPLDTRRVQGFFTSEPSDSHSSIDYRLILANGELLWVRHWLWRRLVQPDGRIILQGVITAIPEQKRLQWECLRISERERNRIGQELHDDLCQELTGLSYMMRVISKGLPKSSAGLHRELDELSGRVSAAMERTRSMAHGLFPAQLHFATLRQALKTFSQQVMVRFGVKVILNITGRLPRHSPEEILHLYRIVQEAASNSIRHGKATTLTITLHFSDQQGDLRIEDNGPGFPPNSNRLEGLGLHVMLHRASILGGALDFGNVPGGGARVHLAYPLHTGRGAVPQRSLLPSE